MDFDLRQWLLILGPVFIVGVLLHGYLRMRASQNEIKMKLDKSFLSEPGQEADVDELNLLKAELPNGGARVIDRTDAEQPRAAEYSASQDTTAENVPVLMEPVDLPEISAVEPDPAIETPPISALDEAPEANKPQKSGVRKAPPARNVETSLEPEVAHSVEDADVLTAGESPEATGLIPKPEKFVVVHVLALDAPFPGQPLLELLLESGMAFGEMDIFHALNDAGEPLFSLASAVEPGTFDLSEMQTFSTPGVTLFLRVHEVAEPLAVLDQMMAVADAIAAVLNGEVRDETRSVLTPQTLEHCRQSIREFEFKHSA